MTIPLASSADERIRPPRWRRRLRVAALAVALSVGALVADGLLLTSRVDTVVFRPPPDAPGTTYLILGSDSRAGLADADQARFGSIRRVPGARADVIMVVHVPDRGPPTLLGLPRDLLVFNRQGIPKRLTVTMLEGQQATVDALCSSLGIAIDHYAMIDFTGFEAVINKAGGVDISIPMPIRDAFTGLKVERPGRQRLNGAQALAFVRSRHPETLVDGVWTPLADGAGGRPGQARVVLAALATRLRSLVANPVALQRTAWAAAGSMTTDDGLGPLGMVDVAQALRSIASETSASTDLPSDTIPAGVPLAILRDGSAAALATVGVDLTSPAGPGTCAPRLLTVPRPSDSQLADLASGPDAGDP